tara:strand:+ start:1242 stop:1400 length:159 start_codon:yes stop_codon:yes gene_type:complete
MPELEDPDGRKQANEPMKKVNAKTGKVQEACNHSREGVKCGVHGMKECPEVE